MSIKLAMLPCTTSTKTLDNVTLFMEVAVQYKVDETMAETAYFKLTNLRTQMGSYVDDIVRSEIPKLTLDEAYEQKKTLAAEIEKSLGSAMEEYGLIIHKALVTDIRPDASVLTAMNNINASRRQRVAAIDKAEAEKITMVTAAEADAEAKYLAGTGMAKMRKAISTGFKESVEDMGGSGTGMDAGEVIHMMLVSQYLDVMKEFACNSSPKSIMINHNPGALTDVEYQVKAGMKAVQKGKK